MTLRFSVFSCMAAALLVALNATALRSLASRHEFLVQELRWLLIATLPMVNILAVVAYLGKTPGTLGFQVGGWTVLAAIWFGDDLMFGVIEGVLVAVAADTWLAQSRMIEDVVILGFIPALLLGLELAAATLGWWVARKSWGKERHPRSRSARLASLAVVALVPVVAIESTLRVTLDPFIARLEPGSRAIVDFDGPIGLPVVPSAGSPLLALAGQTVRVEADAETHVPELVASSSGHKTHIRDRRTVKVALMDGSGESVLLPYCTLRVLR